MEQTTTYESTWNTANVLREWRGVTCASVIDDESLATTSVDC